ncbi:Gfo/Idh/MocA family protein [Thalassolituus sp. LLYu03]|uniref:Gfo/Idh/MocA family protein n=1 Tax=Thalassolituus sp. LLYu03 TaxID=3421656 RepID=UPI003D283A18
MTTDVLIVGCGKIAGGYDEGRSESDFALSHAAAYRKIPSVRLMACVDPDEQALLHFSKFWNVENPYASVSAIPQESHFSVVSICTPTDRHAESVSQCFRFKPNVIFLEKPIATTASEAMKVISQCQQAGVALIVNYSRRWDLALTDFINALQEGQYGPVRKIVGYYTRGLLNNGSHLLEILLRMLGPLNVEFATLAGKGSGVLDPDIDAVMTSEKGISVHLVSTDAEDFARFEMDIHTANAEIRMLDGGLRWEVRKVQDHPEYAGYRKLGVAEPVAGQYMPVMERAISQVLAEAGGDADYSSAMDALAVQVLCETITGAAHEKRF